MPTGGGPYPPPPPKVAIAHAVAEPVQASYDDNYVPSSPYVPGTVVQEPPVAGAPIAGKCVWVGGCGCVGGVRVFVLSPSLCVLNVCLSCLSLLLLLV